MINYIQGTIGLPLVFSINKSGNIKGYVDADFAVHEDMRIHTGDFIAMVTGGAYMNSIKQKLNTKSSTEADLFIVDHIMTQVICI